MALPRHLLGGGERFLVGSSLRSRRDGVTGGSAANALAAAADAILLIGTRLSDFTTASRTLFRNLELIQLNIAAYVISTYECSQFRTEFAVDSPMEEDGFEPSVPEKARLKGSGRLKVLPGLRYARGPLERQPLAFLAALRIRSSALIDTHLSRRRSRAFRPKAPVHAGRRRCRHSTTSVEAELWITDQYFGAANKRDSAIDARGYRVGSGNLRGDIISHAVFRVVKPAAGPMARTVGLQTPNDGETAKVPLP